MYGLSKSLGIRGISSFGNEVTKTESYANAIYENPAAFFQLAGKIFKPYTHSGSPWVHLLGFP